MTHLTGYSQDFLSAAADFEVVVRDMIEGSNWEGIARQSELDLRIDVSENLADVRARTLVLGNRHDQMVAPSASKAIADGIGDAKLAWIEGPHLALMETPEWVGVHLQRHLAIRAFGIVLPSPATWSATAVSAAFPPLRRAVHI